MSRVRPFEDPSQPAIALLQEALAILRRMEQRQIREDRRRDEYRRATLNAKFPYGRPTDRWGSPR